MGNYMFSGSDVIVSNSDETKKQLSELHHRYHNRLDLLISNMSTDVNIKYQESVNLDPSIKDINQMREVVQHARSLEKEKVSMRNIEGIAHGKKLRFYINSNKEKTFMRNINISPIEKIEHIELHIGNFKEKISTTLIPVLQKIFKTSSIPLFYSEKGIPIPSDMNFSIVVKMKDNVEENLPVKLSYDVYVDDNNNMNNEIFYVVKRVKSKEDNLILGFPTYCFLAENFEGEEFDLAINEVNKLKLAKSYELDNHQVFRLADDINDHQHSINFSFVDIVNTENRYSNLYQIFAYVVGYDGTTMVDKSKDIFN